MRGGATAVRGTEWAGRPTEPAAAQQAGILSSDALSLPPSEWASSEVAAPRPAPTPPGRQNPESPCPGGWGTPLGTVLGAPSPGPPTSLAGCGLTGAPRCPGKCRLSPCSLQPLATSPLMLKPELWAVGEGRHGSGRRWDAKSQGQEAGKTGLGRRVTLPRVPCHLRTALPRVRRLWDKMPQPQSLEGSSF